MYGPALSEADLKSLLEESGVVTQEQIRLVDERARSEKESFVDALLWHGFVSDENLGRLLADHFQLPFVDLSQTSIADDVLRIIPELTARKRRAIAFAVSPDGLRVAMADPFDRETKDFLEKKTGVPVLISFATGRDIENALSRYRREPQKVFEEMLSADVARAGRGGDVSDPPIIHIVDTLLAYAYENRASDIHLEPRDEAFLVRFRVDGILHDVATLPLALHSQILSRLKVLAKLRTDASGRQVDGGARPRDGRCTCVDYSDDQRRKSGTTATFRSGAAVRTD